MGDAVRAERSARATRRRRSGRSATLALALSLLAAPAVAQMHPLPPRARPLHERLAQADAAAVVRVEAVETGRLEVALRAALLGDLPARFEIKRSPSNPPPLAEGDLAVVMLQGARPPYVLVDEPRETIRLADASQETRWTEVLERVARGRSDPEELARLYLAWIDEGPDSLREMAFQGLLEGGGTAELAVDRARAAADPARDAEARRLSALLAVRSADGAAELVAAVPGANAEPAVVLAALRGAAVHRQPAALAALERALDHADPAVRIAGLQALPALSAAFGPDSIGRAEALARDDPDAGVRRRAERAVRAARDATRTATADGTP